MALTRKQLLAGFGGKARQKAARSGRKTSGGKRAKAATPSRKSPTMSKLSRLGQRLNVKRMATRAGAGALATYAPRVAGDFGPGLALTAVGVATNDEPVAAMGEVALGSAIARSLGTAAGYSPPSSGGGLI